jgi:hypothetical protein
VQLSIMRIVLTGRLLFSVTGMNRLGSLSSTVILIPSYKTPLILIFDVRIHPFVRAGQLRWSSISVMLTRRSGTAYGEVGCDIGCLI